MEKILMSPTTKLTPIQVLERRKIRLRLKSNELEAALEENFIYVQNHAGSLLRDIATATIVSQLPPWLQALTGQKQKGETQQDESNVSFVAKYAAVADGALDILPLFFKGKKAILISFAVKLARKFLRP